MTFFQFDLFCTSTFLLRRTYFELFTSIRLLRPMYFDIKAGVEDMKMVELQTRLNWCVPHFCWLSISSTFSVLRPLYFALITSTSLLRAILLRLAYSAKLRPVLNLDFLLVEKYRSKYRKGRIYKNGRSTENVEPIFLYSRHIIVTFC